MFLRRNRPRENWIGFTCRSNHVAPNLAASRTHNFDEMPCLNAMLKHQRHYDLRLAK